MPKRKMLLFMFLIAVLSHESCFAQVGGGAQGIPRGTRTNFLYAEPNELTIVISILGEVRSPGRYEISRNLNLLDLLALAGGWTERSDPSDVVVTRVIQNGQRLERRDISVDLSDLTQVSERSLQIEQNDIIQVGRTTAFGFQDVLTYVSTAAVLTSVVFTILNYQSRN